MNTDGLPPQAYDPERPLRQTRASTRLWVRSMLAFVTMLLLLASAIELVAALTTDSGANVPFGLVGACVAVAIACTLAVTRERRG